MPLSSRNQVPEVNYHILHDTRFYMPKTSVRKKKNIPRKRSHACNIVSDNTNTSIFCILNDRLVHSMILVHLSVTHLTFSFDHAPAHSAARPVITLILWLRDAWRRWRGRKRSAIQTWPMMIISNRGSSVAIFIVFSCRLYEPEQSNIRSIKFFMVLLHAGSRMVTNDVSFPVAK